MSYKIVLITSGQPSLNPRLVKEADTLADAGYEVTVLYAYWNDWGTTFDNEQLPQKKWKSIRVGGDPGKQPLTYFFSRILYKITKTVYKKARLKFLAEPAATRSTYFLIEEAKKHKADLYIGHNLGALPATVIAAKKHKAKCGFDAEDFHRQEVNDDATSLHYQLTKYIEDKYLRHTDYITASSPQIAAAYQQLYPGKEVTTILNVFPKSDIKYITLQKPIKVVWFSQTIGKNRGIETILKALQLLNNTPFELHLIGNVTDDIKKEFTSLAQNASNGLFFHLPVAPNKLVDFISRFDIGMASEPGFSVNNNLALSNKIFTYLQAGLAIVASDTVAQQQFMNENPGIGNVYKKDDADSLTNILSSYQSDRNKLINARKASLQLGNEKYNWENERKFFLSLIDQTLNS